MNIFLAIVLWLAITTGGAMLVLSNPRTILSVSLLFFNNLNILIAICEIILGTKIKVIQADYKKLQSEFKGNEKKACYNFLFQEMPIFSQRSWSKMWSTYALYDPSYQNQESFGFFIDFGNGMSTIPPCLLWNAAILFPERCSPLLVGCIGIASYWQIMYGTIVYLLSFFFNERYKGFHMLEISGFVGVANSLWFFFPVAGIYASVCILRDSDFSVLAR